MRGARCYAVQRRVFFVRQRAHGRRDHTRDDGVDLGDASSELRPPPLRLVLPISNVHQCWTVCVMYTTRNARHVYCVGLDCVGLDCVGISVSVGLDCGRSRWVQRNSRPATFNRGNFHCEG